MMTAQTRLARIHAAACLASLAEVPGLDYDTRESLQYASEAADRYAEGLSRKVLELYHSAYAFEDSPVAKAAADVIHAILWLDPEAAAQEATRATVRVTDTETKRDIAGRLGGALVKMSGLGLTGLDRPLMA